MTEMSTYESSKTTTENTYVKLATRTTISESVIQTTADDSIDDAVNTALVEQRSQSSSEVLLLSSHHLSPLPFSVSAGIASRQFWRWFLTPFGFLLTIYGLNVVAWGGMLFLLLCNAAPPAMCHPTCNDLNSPRRIWIEIDSQILNALFCVVGFGLAPWRFRDVYWWVLWRWRGNVEGIRRLAGIHRDWYRLSGSESVMVMVTRSSSESLIDNPAVPLPVSKIPDPPLTRVHAPPTEPWKMGFVIWGNVWNTILQACLAGCMWGLNRFNRPSWTTGLFIGLACVVASAAGYMMFKEGRKVKKIEGAPMSEEERQARAKIEAEKRLGRGEC